MDTTRLGGLTRSLAARFTRRVVVQATGLGVAAGLAGAVPLRTMAQDATPDPRSDDVTFLFVQSAASGTFAATPGAGTAAGQSTPVAGDGADYRLTLTGHTGTTVYFSDRPERIVGAAPTDQFLAGLGFSPDNPPNAALVTTDEGGTEDILVVELLTPSWDADAGSITYGVNILSDYAGDGLAHVASRQRDEALAPSFGAASLFIDDCPDSNPLDCLLTRDCVVAGNLGNRGNCWSWTDFRCEPCGGGFNGTAQECNEQISECGGGCFTDSSSCPDQ